jgi:Zn-dependent protease
LGVDPVSRRHGFGGVFIGRYFGIEFYLHYSWFFIAAFVTCQLATVLFPMEFMGLAARDYYAMGGAAAALFFLSILLHELGHSLVSQRCGIPVPRITLLLVGGVAEIAREPDDARSELKIALGGPAVSLLLVGVFVAIQRVCDAQGWLGAMLVASWLWQANLVLVIFNMFPGYPLDGGRVLRAILWARSGRLRRSTQITSRIGVGFAWLLLTLGLALIILRGQWNGCFLVLIAIFLKGAAEAGYANAVQREVLAGVRVRDFMTPGAPMLPTTLPLSLVVEDYFRTGHHTAYPVCDGEGEFRGLLRLENLKEVPRARWPCTTAGDLVSGGGASALRIGADDSAARAMRRLLSPSATPLAVIEGGKLVGMVTGADLKRFIEVRTALE